MEIGSRSMDFLTRKYAVILAFLVGIYCCVAVSVVAEAKTDLSLSSQKKIAMLEMQYGGRIGLYALDTSTHAKIEYHARERFPIYCTAKMMGVSAILQKSVSDKTLLQRKVTYTARDLIEWSPITSKHVADGMTVYQLCKATISVSDNTAMNLLLKILGGPPALNEFAHSIGNKKFNLKSWWPNEATWQWGDKRDTATPEAMGKSLKKLVLDDVLPLPQRTLLTNWLKEDQVGDKRIRAGTPKRWVVGDKTGTGFYDGGMADIGVIWPAKCKPIVVAVYYKKDQKNAPKQQKIIAQATRIVLNQFAKINQCLANQLQ